MTAPTRSRRVWPGLGLCLGALLGGLYGHYIGCHRA